MSPAPFELPLKASEAATLADITFQLLENRRLQEDLRHRLASRAAGLNLTSIRPYWGSLQQDPVHASSFYLAIDALSGPTLQPMLLRMALASSPASGLFPKAMLIGRMRPGGGREVVVNAANFGPADTAAIDTFATQVDRAFLPRPQGSAPSITVVSIDPERELSVAFEGFRLAQRSAGLNLASIAAPPGLALRTLPAAVWSAIRAGWRDGYNVEAEPLALDRSDLDDAVHDQAAFTRFRAALTENAGEPPADALDGVLEEFGRRFTIATSVCQFEPVELQALHARYAASLAAAEKLFDSVRRHRIAAGYVRAFDFEIVMPPADWRAVLFCLHWLKTRGRPATLIAVPLPSIEEATQLGAVARHFGVTLSFDAAAVSQLKHPSRWAGGRWNCRLEGEITAERIHALATALRT